MLVVLVALVVLVVLVVSVVLVVLVVRTIAYFKHSATLLDVGVAVGDEMA